MINPKEILLFFYLSKVLLGCMAGLEPGGEGSNPSWEIKQVDCEISYRLLNEGSGFESQCRGNSV